MGDAGATGTERSGPQLRNKGRRDGGRREGTDEPSERVEFRGEMVFQFSNEKNKTCSRAAGSCFSTQKNVYSFVFLELPMPLVLLRAVPPWIQACLGALRHAVSVCPSACVGSHLPRLPTPCPLLQGGRAGPRARCRVPGPGGRPTRQHARPAGLLLATCGFRLLCHPCPAVCPATAREPWPRAAPFATGC